MGRRNGKVRVKPQLPSMVIPLKDLPPAVRETLAQLTPMQRVYVAAYCGEARFNGTRAAQRAGVQGSYQACAAQSSNWLKEPRVRAAIDAWLTAFLWSAAELTGRLRDMAEANLGPFVERLKDGALRIRAADERDWEEHKHWLKAVECDPDTGRVVRIVLHDTQVSMRELAKIMKLYNDAPQLNLYAHLVSLSDDELRREIAEARKAEAREPLALPPGRTA
jgi:hypothetical protein